MITPGRYDIDNLFTNASWRIQITLQDSSGVPVNVTGWQAAASIWNYQKTIKYADMSVGLVDPVNGTLELSLTASQTAQLPIENGRIGFWDLLLTEPNGDSYYWVRGDVNLQVGGSTSVG